MAEKEVMLTAAGLSKLESELEHLKTVKRREIAERIKEARDFGDISENSEYEDAKNEQAFIEGRILTLEKMLRGARLIDGNSVSITQVNVGSKVTLKDMESGDIFQYLIVGSAEANPKESKISNESPVGKALLGLPPGSTVEVNVPAGIMKYEILAIAR